MRRGGRRSFVAPMIGFATLLIAGCSASDASGQPASAATPPATSSPAPTALQSAGRSWTAFSEGWLEPLVPAATWGLGLAAVVIVAARISVPLVPWSRVRIASGAFFTRRGGWSILGIVVLALMTATAIAATEPGPLRGTLAVIGLLATAAAGAWCWWWLATRPRVAIRVTDAKGAASVTRSALLTHLVDDLGAAPPRGLESPSASDLTKLTEATSKVSENAFLASVVGILEFVGNTAPWQVEVYEYAERRALVTVRWNGWRIASEPIDGVALDLPDPEVLPNGLERVAAAVVATAMTQHYDDWTGLYGATRWQSVGLHLVGRGLMTNATQNPKAMYEKAVAADEKNRLALAALQNEQYGEATTKEDLDEYLGILRDRSDLLADAAGVHRPFCGDVEQAGTPVPRATAKTARRDAATDPDRSGKPAQQPASVPPRHATPTTLLVRTLIIWAVTLRNRIAVEPDGDGPLHRPRPDEEISALYALATLVHAECDGRPPNDRLRLRMRARTAISIHRLSDSGVYADRLESLAEGQPSAPTDAWKKRLRRLRPLPPSESAPAHVADWFAEALASEDPEIAYAVACHLAMKGVEGPDAGSAEAPTPSADPYAELLRTLQLALRDPANAEWARRDPELRRIQRRYWEVLHPDSPESVRDVEPLKSHKDKLARIGIRSAAALASARPVVGDYLGLDAAEFRRLRETAALAAHLESTTQEPWTSRVPLILQQLVAVDIDTIALLDAASADGLLKALGSAAEGVRRDGARSSTGRAAGAKPGLLPEKPAAGSAEGDGYLSADEGVEILVDFWRRVR